MFLTADAFPPPQWDGLEDMDMLRQLGLQRDISWERLLKMAEEVEQEINDHIDHIVQALTTHDKSSTLVEFIHKKLTALHHDINEPADGEALTFCKKISSILFVPIYTHKSYIADIFPSEPTKKCWTTFSNSCFVSCSNKVFLERNIILCSFKSSGILKAYIEALGIEHPPTCETVIKNLFKLSKVAQSVMQCSTEQHKAIREFLKTSFSMHYVFLERHATNNVLKLLQGKECLFVESDYTYSVVSGDCVVKNYQANLLFPYLCQIPRELTECQKIVDVLEIRNVPSSIQYAKILHEIHLKFSTCGDKLRDNSSYVELASNANDCLIKCLHSEEAAKSVPDKFNATEVYLLDEQLELCLASELVYDDVPWYSKRLVEIQAYRYIKIPPRDKDGCITLPQSIRVRLLSSLVVEELDDDVLEPDNHCVKERTARERNQGHGCPYVRNFESHLLSCQFRLGVLRIIHHQKNTEPSDAEKLLADKLSTLKVSCYHKIKTSLKYVSNGSTISGSSDTVYCALVEHTDNGPILYIAPHCDDHDGVVKEIAQNLNRFMSGIILNESHLEAMIKFSDVVAALDKCKVKPYIAGTTGTTVSIPSVGEEVEHNVCDLVILLNYNAGESVKYWRGDGKLVQAKVVEVNRKLVNNIFAKSVTVSTNKNSNTGISPILLSKYLQPSFYTNWSSGENIDCSGLLVYHLECNSDFHIAHILRKIKLSFQDLSHYQIKVIFKRLFFHSHFYFVRCGKAPDFFTNIIPQYIETWTNSIESVATIRTCSHELDELMQQMGIAIDNASGLEEGEEDDDDRSSNTQHRVIGRLEEFNASGGYTNAQRMQVTNLHGSRRLTGMNSFYGAQRSTFVSPTAQPLVSQPSLPSPPSFNIFGQSGAYSTLTRSGLYKTSTGGYRSRPRRQRPVPANVRVWDQSTATASVPPPLPQTSINKALMWLKQAIADYNAATHLTCHQQAIGSEVIVNNGTDNSCQFPALVCFLSHEVVEKCLKATHLATCGSTLTNQRDLSFVELHNYLSSSRWWPLADIRDFVHQVSEHNKRCRYPSFNIPPEAPCVVYTELDARHALAAAQEVFTRVCSIECFKHALPPKPALLPLLPSTVYLGTESKYMFWTVQSLQTSMSPIVGE